MKINVNVNELQEAIKKSQKLIASAKKMHQLPVLENMLVEAKENKITAVIMDLETVLKFDLPGQITEDGQTLLNVDTLKLIQKLKNVYTLELTGNQITAGNKVLKYVSMEASDYPIMPQDCDLEGFNTTEKEMLDLLSVQYAASTDKGRFLFNSVCIDTDYIVSTDTHRLARKEITFENKLPEMTVIPLQAIKIITGLLDKKSDNKLTCYYSANNKHVQFNFNNITLITRIIEGTYPNYKAVYPQNFITEITVNVKTLLDELSFIEQIAKENHVLTFCTEDNKWFIDAKNTSNAVTLEIPVTITGEEIELMGVNYFFLVDVLKNYNSDTITFKTSGSLTPIIAGDDLILPIRTEGRRNNAA